MALFLLLVHLTGYAHNLLPHESVESNYCAADVQLEKPLLHNHHFGNESFASTGHNTEAFLHINHYDEGLLGFIICFILEKHQQEPNCDVEHQLRARPFGKFLSGQQLLLLIAYRWLCPDTEQTLPAQTNFSGFVRHVLSDALLAPHPRRGPPLLS